ncbi:hypothetical protein CHS0354_033839 [Potamilus streckersoni]|uniref:Sodium/hydrogen exchanger n=1 Tax=Potamilus streckersoni TaxID=2493646 RepID=A0AAE0T8W2_9BIVA|nr:hypothetical protein CHS0354_033839 [Potamilus streckersoni]
MKTKRNCIFTLVTAITVFHTIVLVQTASTDVSKVPGVQIVSEYTVNQSTQLTNGSQEQDHGSQGGHQHHKTFGIKVVELKLHHLMQPLVFCLVVLMAGLSKIGFHHADFLSSKVPESCMLVVIGTILGAIIFFTGVADDLPLFFQPHEFFQYLLPPIILESAYSLHNRTFFENIGSILMYAVVGTVLACFLIGLSLFGLYKAGAMEEIDCSFAQIMVFSALIVAVDPVAVLAVFQEVGVNHVLYFLVFGESLLNDGVTVVLYLVMQSYSTMDVITADQIVLGFVKFFVVCSCGIFIGVLLGLISAFITKYTSTVKVVEPIAIFGFAYLSYILADLFEFSGIISIICCGLIQAQYAFCNVSNKSRLAIKYFIKVVSNAMEILIFLFMGLTVVRLDHDWNTGFTFWTIFLCIIMRFLIVFAISHGINRFDSHRVRKIGLDEMFMISYGGLRGAVCFSLVALLDDADFRRKDMFVTTTLTVIFFTVFISGSTIKPLVKLLQIRLAQDNKKMILYEELNSHVTDHLMAGIEEVVGISGKNYIREKIERFDSRFIRPIVMKDPKGSVTEDITKYYVKLVMKEHYKNLKACGVSGLKHVESNLRAIDSSVYLKGLAERDGDEVFDEEEPVIMRPKGMIPKRKDQQSLRKMFTNALHASKMEYDQRTSWGQGKHFHDKNLTLDNRFGDMRSSFLRNIRQRRNKNACLTRMLSSEEDNEEIRPQSWCEEDAEVCQSRANALAPRSRSFTIDLSRERQRSLDDSDMMINETSDRKEGTPLLFLTPEERSDNSDRHVKFNFSDESMHKKGNNQSPKDELESPSNVSERRASFQAHRQDALVEMAAGIPMVMLNKTKKVKADDQDEV